MVQKIPVTDAIATKIPNKKDDLVTSATNKGTTVLFIFQASPKPIAGNEINIGANLLLLFLFP